MIPDDLSIGTVVKLLSDGPCMTINEIDQDRSTVTCVWYSSDNKLNSFIFHCNAVFACERPKAVALEIASGFKTVDIPL